MDSGVFDCTGPSGCSARTLMVGCWTTSQHYLHSLVNPGLLTSPWSDMTGSLSVFLRCTVFGHGRRLCCVRIAATRWNVVVQSVTSPGFFFLMG